MFRSPFAAIFMKVFYEGNIKNTTKPTYKYKNINHVPEYGHKR